MYVSNFARVSYSSFPPYIISAGVCAACGGMIMGNSLAVMDRIWHPDCFIGNVMCAGCSQPFSLANMLMKMKDGRPYHQSKTWECNLVISRYHPACFEGTTGLVKEESRGFLGSPPISFRAELPKKYFIPGEQFSFHFKIVNPTNYKINKLIAYLIKTETHMVWILSIYYYSLTLNL